MTQAMYRNSCSNLQDKEGDRETENCKEVGYKYVV